MCCMFLTDFALCHVMNFPSVHATNVSDDQHKTWVSASTAAHCLHDLLPSLSYVLIAMHMLQASSS